MSFSVFPRYAVALAFFFTALFSCFAYADPRPVRLPANAPESSAAVVPNRLAPDSHIMGSSLIEGTSFSVRGARGSLGVGLLLGPLGVAANTGYVNSTNASRGDRLGNITQTDVNALLRSMLPLEPVSSASVYELVPMVSAHFTDETHFRIECFIFANILSSDQLSWKNSFFRFVAAEQHDTASPNSGISAEELQTCVRESYRAFTTFVDRRGEFTEQTTVSIEGAPPRTLHYARTEDQKYIIFNYFSVVTSYPVELVTLTGASN